MAYNRIFMLLGSAPEAKVVEKKQEMVGDLLPAIDSEGFPESLEELERMFNEMFPGNK